MKVTTDQLRRATLVLLRHLDETGRHEVEISDDEYWDVPGDARYRLYEKPGELTIGALSDDWSEVQQTAEGQRDPLGYCLVWLASVLRRVGEVSVG